MAVAEQVVSRPRQLSEIYRGGTVYVITLGLFQPLLGLYRFFVLPIDPDRATYALLAMVLYLPMELFLLVSATRASPWRWRWWILTAMAVATVAPLPILGAGWLGMAYIPGALMLVTVRRPWSLVLFGVIVVGVGLVAAALGHPEWARYFVLGIPLTGLPTAIVVVLIRTARELEMLRRQMADEAVFRERVRIADELQETVLEALERVAHQGDLACQSIDTDNFATVEQLHTLVDTSRSTLAYARRLIRRYQSAPLDAELEAAVRLLAAAGIETRMALGAEESNGVLDAVERAALRRRIADLLTGPAQPSRVNITVVGVGGRPHVEIQPEAGSLPPVGTTVL